jgi:hypothetical protein
MNKSFEQVNYCIPPENHEGVLLSSPPQFWCKREGCHNKWTVGTPTPICSIHPEKENSIRKNDGNGNVFYESPEQLNTQEWANNVISGEWDMTNLKQALYLYGRMSDAQELSDEQESIIEMVEQILSQAVSREHSRIVGIINKMIDERLPQGATRKNFMPVEDKYLLGVLNGYNNIISTIEQE